MAKNYEELEFTDDFMFCKVLTNKPKLCKELLELIIGKKVGKFVQLDKQQPIEITSDGKGVRFDVYCEDDQNTVFDCEMQTGTYKNLPKRSRYYQGMIDLNLIERGADYRKLKKSYIIFICPVDVFGLGLHKYTFENRCAEIPDLLLGDEAVKIFLCAGGTADDVSEDMRAFLEYISGKKNNNRFVQKLEAEVEKARNREEWRMEYMTLLMRDQEMINKGREEGREGAVNWKFFPLFRKGTTMCRAVRKNWGYPKMSLQSEWRKPVTISLRQSNTTYCSAGVLFWIFIRCHSRF